VEGQHSALGKAGQQDTLGRGPAINLILDKIMNLENGLFQAWQVGTTARIEIKPGPRPLPAEGSNRHLGSMGKYKANRQVSRQAKLRHDGFEVVPISTQTMEPNNDCDRRSWRIYFYRW
jgi:hypothetical protein